MGTQNCRVQRCPRSSGAHPSTRPRLEDFGSARDATVFHRTSSDTRTGVALLCMVSNPTALPFRADFGFRTALPLTGLIAMITSLKIQPQCLESARIVPETDRLRIPALMALFPRPESTAMSSTTTNHSAITL